MKPSRANFNSDTDADMGAGAGAEEVLQLDILPLIPSSLQVPYFALDGVRTKAGDLTLLYDATGDRYNRGKGMALLLNGVEVARRRAPGLGQLAVNISFTPTPPPLPPPPAPTPSPAPAPPTPPAPPAPIGFAHFNDDKFCCDQALCDKGESKFLFEGAVKSVDACAEKCKADSRCKCNAPQLVQLHFILIHLCLRLFACHLCLLQAILLLSPLDHRNRCVSSRNSATPLALSKRKVGHRLWLHTNANSAPFCFLFPLLQQRVYVVFRRGVCSIMRPVSSCERSAI